MSDVLDKSSPTQVQRPRRTMVRAGHAATPQRALDFVLRPARLLLIGVLSASTALSGCVPLVVGGAAVAGTALVVSDRRTPALQAKDTSLSRAAEKQGGGAVPANTSRVNAMTFNQRVLLTGEVASEQDKQRVEQTVRGIDDVADVVNQLVVGPVADFETRSNDTWISTKVKAELLTASGVPSGTILVTTSQGTVYLMGLLNPQEADAAANIASQVSGVKLVVKVFDISSNVMNALDRKRINNQQGEGAAGYPQRVGVNSSYPAAATTSTPAPAPSHTSQPQPSSNTQTFPLQP